MRLVECDEDTLVAHLRARLPAPPRGLGIGDDCAVLPGLAPGLDRLCTTDAVVEALHFTPGDPPEAVAHKAVARTLSDLAAMGGTPEVLFLNLALPGERDWAWFERLVRGLADAAARYEVVIGGGDLRRSTVLSLDVFALGSAPAGQAATRSGGRPGDVLAVTGALGGSFASGRHLAFTPRLAEGQWLRPRVHAMMDLSDGLFRDLPRLCAASGCGAQVRLDRLPLHPDVPSADPAAAWQAAGGEGEDYELLVALPGDQASGILAEWPRHFHLPLTAIGELTSTAGCRYLDPNGLPWTPAAPGFDHFRIQP